MENKTHYRKVFKSDHLGVADLEDMIEEKKLLVFTIKEVKQYLLTEDKNSGIKVAGKRISANIAYFKENIKPLVLNAKNSAIVKAFNDNIPFVEAWNNTIVELYIDPKVTMKGITTGGVRIRQVQPRSVKPELIPNTDVWNNAVDYLQKGGNIESITNKYKLTAKNNDTLLLNIK